MVSKSLLFLLVLEKCCIAAIACLEDQTSQTHLTKDETCFQSHERHSGYPQRFYKNYTIRRKNVSTAVVDASELLNEIPTEKVVIFKLQLQCPETTRVNIVNRKYLYLPNVLMTLWISPPCRISLEQMAVLGKVVHIFDLNFTGRSSLEMISDHERKERVQYSSHHNSTEKYRGLETILRMEVCGEAFKTIDTLFKLKSWKQLAILKIKNADMRNISFYSMRDAMPNLQSLTLENSVGKLLRKEFLFPWANCQLEKVGQIKSHLEEKYRCSRKVKRGVEELLLKELYRQSIIELGTGFLRVLDLRNNKIEELGSYNSPRYFSGWLDKLDIGDNALRRVSESSFRGLLGLKVLDLSYNFLEHLPTGIFRGLNSLRELRLNNNRLTNVGDAFQNVFPFLRVLHMGNNQLRHIDDHIDYRTILSGSFQNLKIVHLENNTFKIIPHGLLLLPRIREINLSDNSIGFNSWSDFIEMVDISEMQSNLYLKKRNNISGTLITLQRNAFTYFSEDPFRYSSDKSALFKLRTALDLWQFDLSDNKLLCDCRMRQLKYYIDKLGELKVKAATSNLFKGWKCEEFGVSLTLVPLEKLRCEKCPPYCSCRYRFQDSSYIVNCAGKNVVSFPSGVPEGSVKLYLTNNRISTISEFEYLKNITVLDLSFNYFTSLNPKIFSKLTQLRRLDMRGNGLVKLPNSLQLHKGISKRWLDVRHNPFECDCNSRWMPSWIINHAIEYKQVQCANGRKIYKLKYYDFHCNLVEHRILPSKGYNNPTNILQIYTLKVPQYHYIENNNFKRAVIALSLIFVISVVVTSLVVKYHREIKLLLYTRLNLHPFDQVMGVDSDPSKIYDAFVSYTSTDSTWVHQTLIQTLEHEHPYKICIHERDFEIGATIQENILNSVKLSKRMIMVLSREFLGSEWCMLEFRAAHHRVLKDRANYLIIILLQDLDTEELDEELKLYLRTNTYLNVNNRWFWEKLMYALPCPVTRERVCDSNNDPGDEDQIQEMETVM